MKQIYDTLHTSIVFTFVTLDCYILIFNNCYFYIYVYVNTYVDINMNSEAV